MVSMANALNNIAGFGMMDAASRSVHEGIRNLCLQMAKSVLDQPDPGQMERLIAEILVTVDALTVDALFGGHFTNVIVEEAKCAKDWNKFC